MPSVGFTDRPEAWEWWTATNGQTANVLTMPERGRITKLGAWIRGVSGYGAADYRLVLWHPDGAVWAQGPKETVSAAAAGSGPNTSNLVKIEHEISDPPQIEAGEVMWAGFAFPPAGALQSGWHDHGAANSHRHKDSGSGWPGSMSGATNHGSTGSIGAYVIYEPIAGAWVRRGGAWVRADAVYTRRGGAWVEVDSVSVRRGGAWTEAD